ncbi:hypothetical protein F5144DRAFT_186152 [Chaetomium tenue]|uniref:Uncharacterized protein n=1 Tax=Chaetomium tenue TaxID=1854479 RepID=A0ACB7PCH1_9PEZI|nr:hypothetical protein F5144DRAFT_186152 [Chaetomium globosum]
MSADLFALFGDAPETTDAQRTQQTPAHGIPKPSTAAAPAASDPFSFISSTASTFPSQSTQQSTPQWPPFQQTTTGQSESWLTSPVSQPQTSSVWGDIGSLGGLGGFQNQATASPAPQGPVQAEEDDDGWGDFEVAPTSPPPPPLVPAMASNPPRAQVTRMSTIDIMSNKLVDLNLDLSTPDPYEQRASWESSGKTQQPQKSVRNPDPNVLFDADFEAEHGAEDDDDFGDFETGTPATAVPLQTAPPSSALDLLSLDSDPVASTAVPAKKQPPGLTLSNATLQSSEASYPKAPKSPYGSFHHRKPEPVKQLEVKPPTLAKTVQESDAASPSPAASWSAVEDDDFGSNWEEFENLPDSKPTTTKPNPKPASQTKPTPKPPAEVAVAPEWEWQDWGGPDDQPAPDTTTTTSKAKPTTKPKSTTTTTTPQPPQATLASPLPDPPSSPTGPPPTNIPPPSILLSLFPTLLTLPTQALLQPLSTLPPSSPSHHQILTSPTTLTFLRGYLALARVAARLITGRKLRWHRDKFLAQGMSISAAPAGGGGAGKRGMKLAGVDKARAAHDEREAAEVVAAWKGQVGRVRAVVAAAAAAHGNESLREGLRVPEVAMGLAVSTAKGVPTAPRACVVCGLRREERVAKVDGEVEDSFGEWWVEFWGHRECRNFWVGHESELRQR